MSNNDSTGSRNSWQKESRTEHEAKVILAALCGMLNESSAFISLEGLRQGDGEGEQFILGLIEENNEVKQMDTKARGWLDTVEFVEMLSFMLETEANSDEEFAAAPRMKMAIFSYGASKTQKAADSNPSVAYAWVIANGGIYRDQDIDEMWGSTRIQAGPYYSDGRFRDYDDEPALPADYDGTQNFWRQREFMTDFMNSLYSLLPVGIHILQVAEYDAEPVLFALTDSEVVPAHNTESSIEAIASILTYDTGIIVAVHSFPELAPEQFPQRSGIVFVPAATRHEIRSWVLNSDGTVQAGSSEDTSGLVDAIPEVRISSKKLVAINYIDAEDIVLDE